MLEAAIRARVGTLEVSADVDIGPGEVVALLGPNGAGKTTILRCVAGLLPLDDGRIALDGRVLDEPSSSTFVATADRSIGVVFQDYLLFPRLSALDNVAFGLRARGRSRDAARAEAATWLARFDVHEAAASRPAALSGGQAQRVALARALATSPRLLLLDEPMSALDATARVHVRAELRRHLTSFDGARLLITHDPLDALVLADRLVILENGRVSQSGTPAEVTARPASTYVAELVGINLLVGRAVGTHVVRLEGGTELTLAEPPPVGDVAVAIRPRAVVLHRERPEGSARNCWQGSVVDLEADRDRVRVRLDGPVPLTAEVTPAAVVELALGPGSSVWASVKAVDLVAYER